MGCPKNSLKETLTARLDIFVNSSTGKSLIEAKLKADSGLYFYTWTPVASDPRQNLTFVYHSEIPELLQADIWAKDENGLDLTPLSLTDYTEPGQNGWYQVTIPMADLNPQNLTLSGFTITNFVNPPETPIYLDEIRLPLAQ